MCYYDVIFQQSLLMHFLLSYARQVTMYFVCCVTNVQYHQLFDANGRLKMPAELVYYVVLSLLYPLFSLDAF